MPISTDSEVWKQGEESTRLHKRVLAFLRDHPNQAYRQGEIADEVLNTTFAIGEERERIQAELTDEEYNDRYHEDDLPGGGDHYPLANTIVLQKISSVLGKLRDYDLIAARKVDAEPFDLPETETVIVYTYDEDVDYQK
ncbi:hypothetical protein [Halalkalicoccus jeotgali]|uniref:hypothetical protein n=1 Tax=Halalkalicoccus jeotgali TaxID=413810 RepID=UPI00138B092A|nr:hypothetical protein [Halalkalicoccus jeotgali]